MTQLPKTDEATSDSDRATRSLITVLRNMGYNLGGMVLSTGLNFITIFVLARRLGRESLGVYFSVFAIGVVIHFLLEGGFITILTRKIARKPDCMRDYVADAGGLLVALCGATLLAMVLVGLIWDQVIAAEIPISLFVMGGVAVASRQVVEFCGGAFRGVDRFEYENGSRVLQAVLFFGLVLVFVQDGSAGLVWAFVALMLSNFIAALPMLAILVFGYRCTSLHLRWSEMKHWYLDSLPLGIGDTFRRLIWQVDTLLLSLLQPLSVVGLFSVAYRPLQPLQLMPRTLASVTFPMMSRMVEDRRGLGQLFGRSTNLLWIISLPIAVFFTIGARPLIDVAAGREYLASAAPLQLLIWTVCASFITAQARLLLTALGQQKAYLRIALTGLVAKTAVGLALIPLFGLYGACFGALLGELFLVTLGLVSVRQQGIAGLWWGRMCLAVPPAVVFAGILALAQRYGLPGIVVAALPGLLVYIGLCVLLRAVPRDDLAHLGKIVERVKKRIGGRGPRATSSDQPGEAPSTRSTAASHRDTTLPSDTPTVTVEAS